MPGQRQTNRKPSSGRGTARTKASGALAAFSPAVAGWFRKAFAAPSPAQVKAWPAIRRGDNTLLLAPTGSGKTLAAFLCAIDELWRQAEKGDLAEGIQVLYISPLEALGNDIHKNLLEPLAGIRKRTRKRNLPEIRVAVRTGDTSQSERVKMIRHPPHILITTPESLYILLSSKRMAPHLASIRTVIVDEVHALCDNKRGVHLAVSLERLEACLQGRLQRVGCSATLSPLEEIAAFLAGRTGTGRQRPCKIIDAGMRKNLDVQVRAPLPDFLEASNTALWSSAYELLLEDVRRHKTSLIFTNSRYKAERTSLRLAELCDGKARIGAHHGSMSKEVRLEVEDDLKSGRLDALVATASLELGIDIGAVDMVYQLESPKSMATGLQRIGRAGHLLDATSKGRILCFERDELLEAAAICRSMIRGEIDAVRIPRGCLDVLAQQIAGAVAARDWQTDELFGLIRRAYPYGDLPRDQFDGVVTMLAGELPFEMSMAPRPLLLWDRLTDRLSASRSAAHVSVMCAGTIPESSEYDVFLASRNKKVGTLEGGFVDDCLRRGDVFVLGSSSWRVVGVRKNRLLVEDAPGSTPTVPWWLGPIASRTTEVGERVGELRREVASRLGETGLAGWLQKHYHVGPHAAAAIIDYVREQQLSAGLVPDEKTLLIESWRDELGRLNVIVHSPLGSRINRTWGVAVAAAAKKKFRQDWSVVASNDVLLLTRREPKAPTRHKVTGRELLGALTAKSAPKLLKSSAQDAVGSGSSFRDAAVCAFQILRAWQGRRIPPWLQNHRAAELYEVAASHADYPVVAEVLRGYYSETLDAPALEDLLGRIASGEVNLVFRDVEAPSPFAHSVLIGDFHQETADSRMGRERRAHLLRMHRRVLQEVLTSEQMAELLDDRAIERAELRLGHRSETTRARTADELAQCIRDLGDLPATMAAVDEIVEGKAAALLRSLVRDGGVVAVRLEGTEKDPVRLVTVDLWSQYADAFASGLRKRRPAVLVPRIVRGEIAGLGSEAATKTIPARLRKRVSREEARAAIIERYLRCRGPVTAYEIMNRTGWPIGTVEAILDELVTSGKAAKGVYTNTKPAPQWVNKANLEEIHRLTMGYLKRELAACEPYEVMDFMTRWQHRHPATRLTGVDGLREVIGQLQGFEMLQGPIEPEVLAARVEDYRPEMLDGLMASGEVCWRRVGFSRLRRGLIALCIRRDLPWLARGRVPRFDGVKAADVDIADQIVAVRSYFRDNGPAFFDDMVAATGVDQGAATRAVWHLMWCGELTCDTYESIRHAGFEASLSACYDLMNRPESILAGQDTQERVLDRMKRRKLNPRLGRWSPTERLRPPKQPLPDNDVARRWAQQLLRRWGIVSKDMIAPESAAPAWGKLVPEFKRLELLGKANRGYFVEGHQGDQYGLPEAIEMLRECRARRSDRTQLGYLPDEPLFTISSRDPANLYTSASHVVEERGSHFPLSQRSGNVYHSPVVQAGQVLVFRDRWSVLLLAQLTREQLRACLRQLQRDCETREPDMRIATWNNHPIDVSPAAAILWELGFRYNAAGDGLCWPPPRKQGGSPPPPTRQDTFLPYYAQPAPVDYDAEWIVSRAPDLIREKLKETIEFLDEVLPEECEFGYTAGGLVIRYKGWPCVFPRILRKRVDLHVTHGNWYAAPPVTVDPDTDVGAPAFASPFLDRVRQLCDAVDTHIRNGDPPPKGWTLDPHATKVAPRRHRNKKKDRKRRK